MKNQLEYYFDRLFPLNRSITGDGVRKTFEILNEIADFKITEYPSGKNVLDWTIPKEWKVNKAYLLTPTGEKIANYEENNLHVVGYSTPYVGEMEWKDLEPHLHFSAPQPNAIPYVTSYYKDNWGFCITKNQYDRLPREGVYKVLVDTELFDGAMTLGDIVLEGESPKEVFFTSYCCHPSMANNEISGMLALTFLYQKIKKLPNRKYTYRFCLAPETIGAITYLNENGMHLKKNMISGLVLTCCGDKGPITFKKSREGELTNNLIENLLTFSDEPFSIEPFTPLGSDERQYCSPGFNLPVGTLCRTMFGKYPEYHTSLDNKNIMDFDALNQFIDFLYRYVLSIEQQTYYMNTKPYGEPMLGKRGLYPSLRSHNNNYDSLNQIIYLLNYSDGKHSTLDIANKLNIPLHKLKDSIKILTTKKLLKELDENNV